MFIYTWVFLFWYLITVISGLRSANGYTSGILSSYGRWFDEIFGVSGCAWIPGKNQRNYERQIYYNCDEPIQFPLAGDNGNSVTPTGMNPKKTTVVAGVGTGKPSISNGGTPVSPVAYINWILTGNSKGNPVDASVYNKKIFKEGTPFYNRSTDGTSTTGYYYTTDAKGNEVPIFDPIAQYSSTYDPPTALMDGTYGPNDPNTGVVSGWNAVVQPVTGIYHVSHPTPSTTIPPAMVNEKGMVQYNSLQPTGGTQWPVVDVSRANGNVGGISTMNYIANTQYLNTKNVYFKSFPVQSAVLDDPLELL